MKKVEEKKEHESHEISRRDVLVGLGAAAAAMAYSGNVMAAMPGHDHSMHSAQQPKVLAASNNCTDKGTNCISHCLVAWNEGDLELAACAKKVNEMNAVCDGFSKLLAANSGYVKEYAKICKAVCNECAKECRKHDQHHECRECAEACETLVKEINKSFA
ncbi:MAG: Csp1 family four helix bundle copper storage protein [Gammaproteobacteria bacterium]|nr:Csp1 family four helix bundle copper storage protein [Gammaproteobacteria bacterium]